MIKKKINNIVGFCLIEILLVMGFAAVLISAIFLVYSEVKSSSRVSDDSIVLQSNSGDFSYISFNELSNKISNNQIEAFRVIEGDMNNYNVFIQKNGQQFVVLSESWSTSDEKEMANQIRAINMDGVSKENIEFSEGISPYDLGLK